jgi:hypothetical protein
VIRPALQRCALWSPAAEVLVFGTGLVESEYRYLDQTTPGPGPAYGFWQMEEPTHDDLWVSYLSRKTDLSDSLIRMAGFGHVTKPPVIALHGNLFYAAAMCRVRYLPARPALPAASDALGMAEYWLKYYNRGGKGTIERALPYFRQAVV